FGYACTRHPLASTRFPATLRAPRGPTACPNQCQGAGLGDTPPFERRMSLYPRGPRSGPGYAVPVHHHFSAPSAPLAGTSRLHRHAASTRCLRCAGAPRRPTSASELSLTFLLDMSSSETPGSPSAAYTQSLRRRRWSSPMVDGLDTSKSAPFRGYLLVRSRYNLPSGSPPLRDLSFRAFDGSVALPIAAYNYGVRLGNLHRWDFHPLERQLASLLPPSGSSGDG